MNSTIVSARRRAATLARRGLLIAGFAALLAGCNTDDAAIDTTGGIPNDYRQRHPIAITRRRHSARGVRRRRPRRS